MPLERTKSNIVAQLLRQVLPRRMRPILLFAVGMLIIIQVVALSPSSIEDPEDHSSVMDPELFVPHEEQTLATGIPKGKVPEYTVDGFHYVSTQGTEKQWKIIASKALLYNHEKLVHARKVKAFLYDPDGKITVVTGREAKYFMNQKDLEIFGDVQTTFPDGFVVTSEYLHYRTNERFIEIPHPMPVHGMGKEESGQTFEFNSLGFDFAMVSGLMHLQKNARVIVNSPTKEKTVIESDYCEILRNKQLAHFTMSPNRPQETRFVHITQPNLFARSRRADLNYGDYSKLLNYMVAFEDVLIKEPAPKAPSPQEPMLKYATGGRADFDARKNVIVLTEYPQAYQDHDTVTGDVIVLHRDTDIVEVEHSNAFSQGSSN